ncbi:MAG: response regulator transcription factor [Chloroflexi bacterium]|nr:response regulator transcription factor [Chloroflexota bacterium]
MTEKIQIVVIDDHPLFRDGVVNTLRAEDDFQVIAEGTTAAEAVKLAGEHLPDLLLLDINIPGGGLNVVQKIAAISPVTKIVMLTASEEEDDVVQALKAGARAYIVKGVAARELKSILRAVHSGEAYVTPTLAAALLSDYKDAASGKKQKGPLDDLTEREREILEFVANGKSNKEIAAALFLSEKTVKHHMTNILQKLHVRNRVEAALLAQTEARQ